ncbi:MAG: ATP-binding protein [Acidobacteriia bacterium]|nr:ATP-binding protein [Terriglobia bacterium]
MDHFDISESTLILRLKSTEHDFVERKSKSDKGGWLQTVVGFANSAPIGLPAILFVGADDEGNPQLVNSTEMETVIRSVSDTLDRAFPAIYRHIVPVRLADRACLAVIVPGSAERPHFAGRSYVRVGGQTRDASEAAFAELIAQRNSKARKLLEYKGKQVTLDVLHMKGSHMPTRNSSYWLLAECNQFFVSLRVLSKDDSTSRSIPVESLEISWDDKNSQLKIVTEE